MKKLVLNADVYYGEDSLFPMDYFEISLEQMDDEMWIIYFKDEEGSEKRYGPHNDLELLSAITKSPFLLDELVWVYHLVESTEDDIKQLGVSLLKNLANQ